MLCLSNNGLQNLLWLSSAVFRWSQLNAMRVTLKCPSNIESLKDVAGIKMGMGAPVDKYHNHKPQTTPRYREEEPLNHHETPGRQIMQSNQLSLPHQDDCNTIMDLK